LIDTEPSSILVVDDNEGIREAVEKILKKEKTYTVFTASDGEEAVKILQQNTIAVLLTDLRMPKVDGLELLKIAKTISENIEVILITGHGTIEVAVEVMKDGAFDFIQKPFNKTTVLKTVRKAIEKRDLVLENRTLHEKLNSIRETNTIIGKSSAIRKVIELAAQVASSSATILISGESGVGKEIVALAIHNFSSRNKKSFIKVSCAALPETLLEAELFGYERGAFTGAFSRKEGRFELANEGTLFLDEVGDINPSIQVKLLRVLQNGEFERLGSGKTLQANIRLIAATNASLKDLVKNKKFREDLYYRLNVINIEIPPLRERKEDIPLLAHHFLNIYSKKNNRTITGITKESITILQKYNWPGNVRELENTIERAVILTKEKEITPSDLPPDLLINFDNTENVTIANKTLSIPLGKITLKDIEKIVMEETLKQSGGNKNIASKILGVSARTLYRKMDE